MKEEYRIDQVTKELIMLTASYTLNCQICAQTHYQALVNLGVEEDILKIVPRLINRVYEGKLASMEKSAVNKELEGSCLTGSNCS